MQFIAILAGNKINLINMHIPDFLIKLGQDYPENQNWVDSLPSLIKQAIKKWNLQLESPFTENASCSYVAPCVINVGEKAVLKIGLPHEEAMHEIEGLRVLNGHPAVRLLDFDKASNTMLLERCLPGTQLSQFPESKQDEIITSLLPEIWHSDHSSEKFRPLAQMIELWNKETYENLSNIANPELAKEACKLKEKLVESTQQNVLLATDLHAGNILQAQRREWLVIDLKPYIGDPTYDLTQHLLNCKPRLAAQPKKTIQHLAQLANLDPKRLADWMFARLASKNSAENQSLALKIKEVWR